MKRTVAVLFTLSLTLLADPAIAQMMRPPAFAGGVPGRAQMDAIFMQRHQARTLLYREALEELRKNPQAADVPICSVGSAGNCLAIQAKDVASVNLPGAQTGRRIAVLFGNNDYSNPIPPLETPISDVLKTASVLATHFGFTTHIIKDAGKARIVDELNKIAADIKPHDQVLIFYAGHGYLMEDIKMGFWIPVDASVKTAKGWISNNDIAKMLGAIPANQLILISDSCFSGSLTKEQKITDMPAVRSSDVQQQRSVVVLSSGGDEPVSDEGKDGHSIFAWNLIQVLENMNASTPGAQIWKSVSLGVRKDYPQEPQYGAVVSAGHVQGGDYIFQPK